MFRHFNKFKPCFFLIRKIHLKAPSLFGNKQFVQSTLKLNISTSQSLKSSSDIPKLKLQQIYDDLFGKDHKKIITTEQAVAGMRRVYKVKGAALTELRDQDIKVIFEKPLQDQKKYDYEAFKKEVQEITMYQFGINMIFVMVFLFGDKNKAATLDFKTATAMFSPYTLNEFNEEEMISELKKYDKDGDGKCSYDEYLLFMWTDPMMNPYKHYRKIIDEN